MLVAVLFWFNKLNIIFLIQSSLISESGDFFLALLVNYPQFFCGINFVPLILPIHS